MEVEVSPASLEEICAVYAVRCNVAPERLATGTVAAKAVADAVDAARQWLVREENMWHTPLGRAAARGKFEGMQFCLGETAPAERLGEMASALVAAAISGHVAVVQWLAERGADVHHDHEKAVQFSAFNGHLPMVRWLVEEGGADVHTPFWGPLRCSAWRGHLPVVQWLVEEGGADVHTDHDAALWMSAECGQLAVVQWLVEEGGANVHAAANAALRYSAHKEHLAVVRYLLSPESGAEWTGAAVRAVLKVLEDDEVQNVLVCAALAAAVDRLEAVE